ncbi:MAG: aminotransferase class III-fold pyridoxal phosphate-dependent enzyme, partial [Limibacillus sp.]
MSERSNSLAMRDIAHVLHPYTNWVKHEKDGPLVIEEGKGVFVTDSEGKHYIEGMAGLWCASLGFGEERLVQAAADQMRKLPFYHSFAHKSHGPAIDLAERLTAMAPEGLEHVFFANSGSEANDTVVKFVWFYNNALGRPEKKKIISRIKAYHGVTVASASMTGLPNNHRDFDLPIANILHTDCPHHYRFAEPGESEEDFATRCAESLERMILAEGEGRWVEYAGGYSDMLAQRGAKPGALAKENPKEGKPKTGPSTVEKTPEVKRKLSFKEKHALQTLPGEMEKLREEIAALQLALEDGTLYQREPERFRASADA